jgi:hypothetical protein
MSIQITNGCWEKGNHKYNVGDVLTFKSNKRKYEVIDLYSNTYGHSYSNADLKDVENSHIIKQFPLHMVNEHFEGGTR